jgi:hypothetical protein
MDELITPSQAEILFAGLALALLLVGISAAFAARRVVEDRIGRRGLIFLIASGPLLYALWRLDALLIGLIGFDTLLRLVVELAALLGLGVLLGLWLRGERSPGNADRDSTAEAGGPERR